jgi:hypothetical protein
MEFALSHIDRLSIHIEDDCCQIWNTAMDRFESMSAFVAVAEAGGFSAARAGSACRWRR